LRQSRSVEFQSSTVRKSKPFELEDDGRIVIYDSSRTRVEDIIPLLVKEKRASKHLRTIDFTISWKTIAEAMKTRSVDDIRNFWSIKILPMFDPSALIQERAWIEAEDITLLELIAEQEITDSVEQIDFDDIDNGRTPEENRIRWALLLKGVGSVTPGLRYNPSAMAMKLKQLIETKSERYQQA
jgi:hypothetical protein